MSRNVTTSQRGASERPGKQTFLPRFDSGKGNKEIILGEYFHPEQSESFAGYQGSSNALADRRCPSEIDERTRPMNKTSQYSRYRGAAIDAGAERSARILIALCGVAAGLTLGAATMSPVRAQMSAPGITSEAPFLAENEAAMNKMMTDMTVKPTGDVDHDFVEMMVPHHQGAIDMARAMLRYGHNEQLRRLAQEIIVTQQQEIAAMRLALGEPLPPSVAAPTQSPVAPAPDPRPASNHSMAPMNMK
jgi:hypothetical protein